MNSVGAPRSSEPAASGGSDFYDPDLDPAIQALFDELDSIFGTPKELNEAEMELEQTLIEEMFGIFDETMDGDLSEEQLARLEEIDQQLMELYGLRSYDSLSAEEQARVDAIYEELDAYFEAQYDEWEDDSGEWDDDWVEILPVEPADQALFDELDAIFGTPKELNEEEMAQETAILDEMMAIYNSESELSEEQLARLDELNAQLNELYGVRSYDDLSTEEQARVDEIYTELGWMVDDFFDGGFDDLEEDPELLALYEQLDAIFGTPKELTDAEMEQEAELYAAIDALFAAAGENELSDAQWEEIDALFAQVDALYGIRSYESLSAEEQAQVDAIYAQIDEKLGYGDDWDDDWSDDWDLGWEISEEEQALYDELDAIFGTPKELNEEEQAREAAIFEEMMNIYHTEGEISDEQWARIEELDAELNALYGIRGYDDLSADEQARVDEIYEALGWFTEGPELFVEDGDSAAESDADDANDDGNSDGIDTGDGAPILILGESDAGLDFSGFDDGFDMESGMDSIELDDFLNFDIVEYSDQSSDGGMDTAMQDLGAMFDLSDGMFF